MKKHLRFSMLPLLIAALAAPPRAFSADPLLVTPEYLVRSLMDESTDVVHAAGSVLRARDEIAVARGELLPSLSLDVGMSLAMNGLTTLAGAVASGGPGALAGAAAVTPMFLLSSVSCLVPFLFPSKWYDLAETRRSAAAATIALDLARLNAFATAYSLLTRVEGDQAVLKIMEEQRARLAEYVQGLRTQGDLAIVSLHDIHQGELELDRAVLDVERLRSLIGQEHAALRRMLGLPIDAQFAVAAGTVVPSALETSPAGLAPRWSAVVARAPEREQLEYLEEAAHAHVRSTQWAFLTGCAGPRWNTPENGGLPQSVAFSSGANISVGFGMFPRVSLARQEAHEIELRQHELGLELGGTLEATLADVDSFKASRATLLETTAIAENLLEERNHLYTLGRASVRDVLDAYAAIAAARVSERTAQATLDGHRITLQRLALENEFRALADASRRDDEARARRGFHPFQWLYRQLPRSVRGRLPAPA